MQIACGKGSTGVLNLPPVPVNASRLLGAPVRKPVSSEGVLYYLNHQWDLAPLMPGCNLEGLRLSNNFLNTNHLDVAAGAALLTLGQRRVARLGNSITKNLSSVWAAGNGSGGLFSGATITAYDTVHIFLIQEDATGIVDVGFDSSPLAIHRPTGWSARRIGSIPTTHLGPTFSQFTQFGNYFEFKTNRDVLATGIPSGSTLYYVFCPQDIAIRADLLFSTGLPANGGLRSYSIQSPDQTIQAPSTWVGGSTFVGTISSYYSYSPTDDSFAVGTIRLLVPTRTGYVRITLAGSAVWSSDLVDVMFAIGWYDEELY